MTFRQSYQKGWNTCAMVGISAGVGVLMALLFSAPAVLLAEAIFGQLRDSTVELFWAVAGLITVPWAVGEMTDHMEREERRERDRAEREPPE